nr:P-hydroxybenzoate hydroxylase [Raoultella sp. NCTC 9187]
MFEGQRVPLDLTALSGGKSVMVYGQTEVTRDLMAARADCGAPIVYGVSDVVIQDAKSDRPAITFVSGGETHRLSCDFIAGLRWFFTACRGKAFRVSSLKSMKASGRLAGWGCWPIRRR